MYDDGSIPSMRGQLEDFIAAGLVRYRLLEGPLHPSKRQQLAVSDDCLLQARNRHAWMGEGAPRAGELGPPICHVSGALECQHALCAPVSAS